MLKEVFTYSLFLKEVFTAVNGFVLDYNLIEVNQNYQPDSFHDLRVCCGLQNRKRRISVFIFAK